MLKEAVRACVTVAMFSGGVVCAEEPEARAIPNPVVLLKAGDVDDALVQRCQQWAEQNTALSVARGEALTVEQPDFETVAAAVEVKPEDTGLIVLFRHAQEGQPQGVYKPENRLVLINVRAVESDDAEQFARRVERQVLRGIAMLLGQEFSPDPQSVMFPYQSVEELDLIGRNFDPPSLRDLQRAAVLRGLAVDPASDMNMLP